MSGAGAGAPPPAEQALALVRDGRSFFAQGDLERARQCFAAAVRLAPQDPLARSGLERCERLLAEGLQGSEPAGRSPRDRGTDGDTQLDEREDGAPAGRDAAVDIDLEREETVVDAMASGLVEAELERARERGRAVPDTDERGGPRVLLDPPLGTDPPPLGSDGRSPYQGHAPDAGAAGHGFAPAGGPPGPAQPPGLHGGGPGPLGPGHAMGHPTGPGHAMAPGHPPGQAMGPGYAAGPGQVMGPGYAAGPGQVMGPGYAAGPGQAMGPGYAAGPGQPMSPGQAMGPPHAMGAGHPGHAMDPGHAAAVRGAAAAMGAEHAMAAASMDAYPDPGAPHGDGMGAAAHGGSMRAPLDAGASGPHRDPASGFEMGAPHAGGEARPPGEEPRYPRYVASSPGNYPQPSPGGRDAAAPSPIHRLPSSGPTGFAGPAPGPYASYGPPAPGYSGPTPMMGGAAPGAPRTTRFWVALAAAIGVCTAGLGLLIGFAVFGGADEAPAHGASAAPRSGAGLDAGAGEGAEAPAGSRAGAATGASAGPDRRGGDEALGAAEARVNRVEHPVIAAAVAPTSGSVERVHVKAGGTVTTGQKLYSLRDGHGARAAEAVVSAPAAGRIERRAARGDQVQKGDVLAQLVDPTLWLVVADLTTEDVTTAWSCQVSTAEGRERASCRIEGVQRFGGQQSRVTASVSAEAAGWLQGGGQELILALSPAQAPGAPAPGATPSPRPTTGSGDRPTDATRARPAPGSTSGPGAPSPTAPSAPGATQGDAAAPPGANTPASPTSPAEERRSGPSSSARDSAPAPSAPAQGNTRPGSSSPTSSASGAPSSPGESTPTAPAAADNASRPAGS